MPCCSLIFTRWPAAQALVVPAKLAVYSNKRSSVPFPLVLDADALNILASDGRLEGKLYKRVAPAILTPHPAEAARLLACSVREVQIDRVRAACELANVTVAR